MHALIVHQIFTLPSDGGGTRHFDFARYLTGLGHKVTVVTTNIEYLSGKVRKSLPADLDGIEFRYVKSFGSVHKSLTARLANFLWFAIASVYYMLAAKNVDIICGTSPPLFQSASCLLCAKLLRIPFVFEVRDLWLDFGVELGVIRKGFPYHVLKYLERVLYRRSDAVVVNSPGYLPYVQSKNVALIPNGVEISEFEEPVREDFRKAWDLQDKIVCVYVGNIGIANDADVILGAAERLLHETDIVFVFVGGGLRRGHYENLASSRNLHNVIFKAPVAKSRIPDLIKSSDVGIATLKAIPLFSTPFPNKVFDYMAAGVPVVLAIDGEIRKVIEAAEAGLVTTPGDAVALANAVKEYSQNPDLRKKHGENGLRAARELFNRQNMAAKFERLISDIVSKRSSRLSVGATNAGD
jgi:glycosyltransferase involved in cell wall biosynthesis